MDPLRLVLLIAGIGVVLGIYIWERRRLKKSRYDNSTDEQLGKRAEPYIADSKSYSRTSIEAERAAAGQHSGNEEISAQQRVSPRKPESGIDKVAYVPIINIVAGKQRMFSGHHLDQAFAQVGLMYGDMDIYHYHASSLPGSRSLFKVANLVKPGSFPKDSMEQFTTPGITLFFLPGEVDDPIAVFDRMLDVARLLADSLEGELTDDQHKALGSAQIDRMRHRLGAGAAATT